MCGIKVLKLMVRLDVVIKPHEYCYRPDSLFPMIKCNWNKVEVNPLPLNTPIYKNKASLSMLISMNESKLGWFKIFRLDSFVYLIHTVKPTR